MQEQFKVLSMWQPWATLIVHGIKEIETRPSPTNWTKEKGSYLIHAAKKWDRDNIPLIWKEPFFSELTKLGYINDYDGEPTCELLLGYIIGAIDIVICREISISQYNTRMGIPVPVLDDDLFVPQSEIPFGDYREGRYAWITANPRILINPIPYKGRQGYYQNFKGDINQLKFK